MGLGPHSYNQLTLTTILKAPSPDIVTLGVKASTYELGVRGATQFTL